MAKRVLTDTPISEITLRRYEKPYKLSPRELSKKACLSLGLLQPGDSRDIIADILLVLLEHRKNPLNAEEIRRLVEEERKREGLSLTGTASSNIRRQLRRLRELFLVEKKLNRYSIAEGETLKTLFEEKIERFLLPSITERVRLYLDALDSSVGPVTEKNKS